jgi:myo-inositol-1(or 4)-monophosphatase
MNIDMSEVCEWARIGGSIARRYFHQPIAQHRKADNTHVTQADIEIERFLRERIGSRYPQHGIMGEEQGIGSVEREYVWSLDPLDGTDAYVSGLPVWAVSIGLLRNGEPYLGVIYLPLTDECYWADTDGIAYCNGHPISVSDAHDVAAHHAIMVPSRSHSDYDINFPGKARSLGSFAAHFCYVARGSVLGALLGYPQLWDIAAGLAILRAAGGRVVLLSGEPFDDVRAMLDGRRPPEPLLISTPALVRVLLPYIQTKGTA